MVPTASSLLRTDDGSLRVTRMLFMDQGRDGMDTTGRAGRGAGHRQDWHDGLGWSPATAPHGEASVSHREPVPAVIARNGGLDQTLPVGITAGDERQHGVARVLRARIRRP